ncbi:hypothetical protein ACFWA9_10355 [Kitasatospora sp. NPDC059973]|uniref:hypothetical protein n=1 Tax=Kitasatospora sp. NPDC059973 TaxID=3347020 RepID=UPI00369DB2F0
MSTIPLHEIEIPAAEDGAVKPWRKRLEALDETKRGGYVCVGSWVEPGAVYRLPAGALIVGVDRTSETARRVRLWRVTTKGELTATRDSVFKSYAAEFGDGVRKTLRSALDKYPPTHQGPQLVRAAAPQAPQPNERADHCALCRRPVPAGAGLLVGKPGSREVQHKPGECPPLRNERGQRCSACGGWVEPGDGLLSSPIEGVWNVRHDGTCPPEAERQAPPPPPRRRNERAGTCVRCGQDVAELDGWLIPPAAVGGSWSVEHDGECPPPADQHTGPTWRITAGVPGRYEPVPSSYWTLGQVGRFEVYEWEQPVPEDAPGLVRVHGMPSLIGVVVSEERPWYSRDEDGDSPSDDLIGESGWFFSGRVRLATEEEAAPLLAEEGEAAIDRALGARVRLVLSWRYPREGARYLPADELAQELADVELVELRTRPAAECTAIGRGLYPERVWIAEGRDWVMTTAHNGMDGDDWSLSNWGREIALLHPMTDELRRLVDDLTARYGAGTAA